MAKIERNILIPLDGDTYNFLSSIVEKRKKMGEKGISVTGFAKEILQETAGNIEKERPIKFQDLEQLKKDLTKQYDRNIERVVKFSFKSSRIILNLLLVFLDGLYDKFGEKKVQARIDGYKKHAISMLKKKEEKEEG